MMLFSLHEDMHVIKEDIQVRLLWVDICVLLWPPGTTEGHGPRSGCVCWSLRGGRWQETF